MAKQLLSIKIHMPPLSGSLLDRPCLVDKAEAGLWTNGCFARPLTLISAPAGYGKTTLARQWMHGRETAVSWYTLDQGDNQRERFWLYLAASLQSAGSDVGRGTMDVLRSAGESFTDRNSFLTPLLNDLFAFDGTQFLVLDDYHVIDTREIHADMAFFIENLPPSVHLVVTSRSEPPWPLARWRSKGQLGEIRQRDLVFKRSETTSLFTAVKGMPLDDGLVDILHHKTEGWITALQLAAISMQERSDRSAFIESFAGSHRHVFHFLSDEVLRNQHDEVLQFLRRTSILDRFCGPLCDAVVVRTGSAQLLAYLERSNLFVIPLDEQGVWYRYHPLFADLMRHQLGTAEPDSVAELHRRASQWHLCQGQPAEALRHALKAGDLEGAAAMLEAGLQAILASEGPGLVVQSLRELPDNVLERHPELTAQKAWFHLIFHGGAQLQSCIAPMERAHASHNSRMPEYTGLLAVVRAYYSIYRQNIPEAQAQAEHALQALPEENVYWRSKVGIISGDTRLFTGNPQEAYPLYLESYKSHQQSGNPYLLLSSGFKTATALYYMGRLAEAEALTTHLLETGREQGFSNVPRIGLLWTLLGELLREKGTLDEAERCIVRGLRLSAPEKPSHGWNALFQIALQCSQNQLEAALETIAALEELDSAVALPRFIGVRTAAWKAHVLAEEQQFGRAYEALQNIGVERTGTADGTRVFAWLVLARLLMCDGSDASRARELLLAIQSLAETGQNQGILLETRLALADLERREGHTEQAAAHLSQALEMGCRNRYWQTLLDNLHPSTPLLKSLLQSGKAKISGDARCYAQQLLQALDPDGGVFLANPTAQADSPVSQTLVEPLTERELEILALFGAGLSNQETADKLYISMGTVKWHANNIYGKLGVNNRTHAVTLARKLNLLP